MSSLTVQQGRPPAAKASTRAEGIEAGLRRIHRTLLEPSRAASALLDHVEGSWFRAALDGPRRGRSELLCDDETGKRARADVLMKLEQMPPADELERLATKISDLVAAPPDRAQIRLLVGLAIDAFPNARPHEPATYLETAALQLEVDGFAPAVVAAALRELIRTSTFPPAIAEMVQACERAARHQRAQAELLERAAAGRRKFELAAEVVAAFDRGERYTPAALPRHSMK